MLPLTASYLWIRLEPKIATKGTQIPYCNAMQDDDWNYNQPVDGDEKVLMCLVNYDLVESMWMANSHMWLVEPQVSHMNGMDGEQPSIPLLKHYRYALAE